LVNPRGDSTRFERAGGAARTGKYWLFGLFEIEEKHDHFTFLNIVMTVKRFE
jgi:hypothetical protein